MGQIVRKDTRFNGAIASAICRQIREGEYLKAICRMDGMPSLNTVYHWRQTNEAFARQFAIAREFHADSLADKIRETIDGTDDCTVEQIQARRLKFDGYRYLASKYFPRMYADKQLHVGGDGEGPVQHKLALDYSLLTPHQMVQLRELITLATPRAELPLIEGEAEDAADGEA